ncbi:MAG: 4-amino-4-deoxy-L-arabinose transferase [Gammaproteobacteria bacterium]
MAIPVLFLIVLSMFVNTAAQLLLKEGMNRVGYFELAWHNIVPVFIKVASNYFIIGGFAAYVFSVTIWLVVLSRADVSYAYPLTSIGFILTAVAGYFLMGESVTALRIIGILVIIFGLILVTRS